MNRRLTRLSLVTRGVAASLGSLAMVAVIAAVVAGAAVAGPRVTGGVLQQDLQYRLATTSPTIRDLQASTAVGYVTENGQLLSVYGLTKKLPKFLASAHAAMPPILKSISGPGRYVGRDDGLYGHGIPSSGPPNQLPRTSYDYSIEANPQLRSDAVLVSGNWPGRVSTIDWTTPIQVVTTVSAAKTLDWKIGQVQHLSLDALQETQSVVLVGTIRPRDPRSDYWQLDPTRGSAGRTVSVDGDSVNYFGTVWMDAGTWPTVANEFDGDTIVSWFPVTSGGLRTSQVDALGAEIERFVAEPRTAGTGSNTLQVRYVSNLSAVLTSYLSRAGAGSAVLAVVESGPIGTGAALLLLAVLSVVDRRRRATGLLRSRGASGRAFRLELAAHVAAATIPGAVVGAGIAALATGGAIGWTPWIVAAIVALVPALLAAAAAGSAPVVLARGGVARPSRWRWVIDVVLVLLAALAVFLLLKRGLGSASGLGADPLLTAMPLLVCAAACAIVLRLLPFVLRGLAGVIHRGRGVVGLVGRANSARAGARFLPVFAILTGLSISVFASAILTTEQTGIRAAAVEQAGADISISGSPLSDATVKRLRALPGIQDFVAIQSRGGALIDGQSQSIAVYTVDARALVAVESVLPPDQQLFRLLGTTKDGHPLVYGGGFASPLHSVSRFSDSTAPAISTVRVDEVPPKFIGAVPWLLMDSSAAKDLHLATQTSAVLIRVAPGTDQVELQRRIVGITGAGETVQVADAQVRALTQAPLVSGLEALTVAAIILSLVLCVLALVLALVTGTRERDQVVGRLRALGFSRRQATGLVGWELGPMTLLGVVVGTAVGLCLPLVFLSVVDLTTFIGSSQPPEYEFSPVLVAATIVGFAACAVGAVFVTAALAARKRQSGILREAGAEQ
jgi:putative ABC transport system permease protein